VTTYALRVNGNLLEVKLGASIADVVLQLTGEEDPRGLAVSVDRCVVPRSEWATTLARPDSLVEVVGAAAGG
jgi:thiamine biosynthesis protein ThiS